jgi:formylglycine-generating enzyme required for sulfatase activity
LTIQVKTATYLVFAMLVAFMSACGNAPTQPAPRVANTSTAAATEVATSPATATAALPTPTQLPSATATLALGIGSTRTSPKDGMILVYVPAGSFLMGSDKSVDSQAFDSELPQHTVTLDAFWIDQTLVTNAMYARCVAAGSCTAPQYSGSYSRSSYYGDSQYADYPVINMKWSMADAYCRWAGRQLPTEAQWEKAAHGTDGRIYPWGNQAPDKTLANYNQFVGDTSKVGSYPAGASPYGALDMAGNAYEWVADWYSATSYKDSPTNNPAGPASSGNGRVLRGGSWIINTRAIRSAGRIYLTPTDTNSDFGFRCAALP